MFDFLLKKTLDLLYVIDVVFVEVEVDIVGAWFALFLVYLQQQLLFIIKALLPALDRLLLLALPMLLIHSLIQLKHSLVLVPLILHLTVAHCDLFLEFLVYNFGRLWLLELALDLVLNVLVLLLHAVFVTVDDRQSFLLTFALLCDTLGCQGAHFFWLGVSALLLEYFVLALH